jgi:hypothetical protein
VSIIDLTHRNTVTGKPTHSRRGPSSSNRWLNCTGSVRLIESFGLHEEESSEPAARGTVCHHVAAQCLMSGKEAWEFAGQQFRVDQHVFEIDEEMVPWIDEFVAYVRKVFRQYEPQGAILYVETEVSSEYDPEAYGTADIRIEVPGVVLIIMDAKFGIVRVEPTDEQLRLYGYYAYEMRGVRMTGDGEPKEILLVVGQPRLPRESDHFREHSCKPKELEEWFFGTVLGKLQETRDPNALLTMGDHCTWCPALKAGKCPAWSKQTRDLPVEVAANIMSNEQLAEFRKMRKLVTKFFEGVDGEVFTRLRLGQKIPGAKLVNKTGDRVWSETGTIEIEGVETTLPVSRILEAQYGAAAKTDPKMKSPAQIEKLPGGKALTSRYAYKPDTGMTVADDDDAREPVVGLMERMDQAQADTNGAVI